MFFLFNLNLGCEMVYGFLNFKPMYDVVHDWYVHGVQKMTKNYHDWKCLIRSYSFVYLCKIYKQDWYKDHYKTFFFTLPVYSVPEASRNYYFWLEYIEYKA